MNLLTLACVAFNVHPALVFVFAYSYFEIRKHPRNIKEAYAKYVNTQVLPVVVKDYCLYLLAKRIILPYNEQKLLGGGDEKV
jgi:hypothetical protein